jgi:hypothetical protein
MWPLSHSSRDLGPEYFARCNPAKLANRIRNLGYHVEISAAAQPQWSVLGSLELVSL